MADCQPFEALAPAVDRVAWHPALDPFEAGSDRSPGDPLAGKKILVVDDDVRNLFAMTAFLERFYVEVTVAESGPEALATLERRPDIDLILMDIMMPIMDGYETIRAIRALDAFKSVPIIAVTGRVVLGEHRRCIDAGANDFVPKPVDTAELLAVMRPRLPATSQTT